MGGKIITITNYKEGRERMSRGEVMVPTYYYRLKRGDRAQLIRQGNKPYRIRLVNGLCAEDGHLAGNITLPSGYYYTVALS